MLRLRGLQVERRRVDRDIGESRHRRRNREGPGVVILLLVTVHVPARDRQEVVDYDAGRRLELECGAKLPAYGLLAVERSELFVGQVDDAHLLVIGERLVEAHNEGLPEAAPEQNIAEPPAFDSLRFATRTDVDEVVGRFDLSGREAEGYSDSGAEVQSLWRHSRLGAAAEGIEYRELAADIDVADVRAADGLQRVGGNPERGVGQDDLRITHRESPLGGKRAVRGDRIAGAQKAAVERLECLDPRFDRQLRVGADDRHERRSRIDLIDAARERSRVGNQRPRVRLIGKERGTRGRRGGVGLARGNRTLEGVGSGGELREHRRVLSSGRRDS